MERKRSPGDVRVGTLLGGALALTMLSSVGCAAKVQESEMRAVWVPRDESRGLVIDEEESNMHRLYRREKPSEKSADEDEDEDAG